MLMTNSDTNIEAHENRERLQELVETVLNENQVLRSKLSLLEDRFDARSTFTRDADESSETATIRHSDGATPFRDSARPLNISNRISFAFENILQQSWVYKRNERNDCDQSFITTTTDARSRTWSIFSGISMANISILSVIAMPITLIDINNGHYYGVKSRLMDSAPIADNEAYMSDNRQALPHQPEHPEIQVSSRFSELTVDEDRTEDEDSDGTLSDEAVDEEIFPCKGCGEVSCQVEGVPKLSQAGLTFNLAAGGRQGL